MRFGRDDKNMQLLDDDEPVAEAHANFIRYTELGRDSSSERGEFNSDKHKIAFWSTMQSIKILES